MTGMGANSGVVGTGVLFQSFPVEDLDILLSGVILVKVPVVPIQSFRVVSVAFTPLDSLLCA